MKRLIIIICVLAAWHVGAAAQGKFNPEKFRADLHKYIAAEVAFTQAESEAFFPLFDEMKDKQRGLHEEMRKLHKQTPATDAACKSAVQKYDRLERELKDVETNYHQRMMKVVSPRKVHKAIVAEKRFHRDAFRKAAGHPARKPER